MAKYIVETAILALGLSVGGSFIKIGLESLTNQNRVVNVKGLAEMEVEANTVTWPLAYNVLGNNLPELYDDMQKNNKLIIDFLKKNGIKNEEISISAPNVVDNDADRYSSNKQTYRYNGTSIITVTSEQVSLVRKLINEQTELLKQGIVIINDYRFGVSYDYTRLNDIKPKMIETATKNARAAAEKFAKDSDSKLGKIKNASQGQFSISDRDMNTPHIKKVRVVTTIDYTLND